MRQNAAVSRTHHRLVAPAAIVGIAVGSAMLSRFVIVGADAMWLVAMGDRIRQSGAIPVGVPFVAADTSAWVNVPALGQLTFSFLDGLGAWGLITAQLLAAAAMLGLLSLDARARGANSAMTVACLSVFVVGNLASLGIVRAQLWSLPLFTLLVWLLRSEQDLPSRRIWLAVPVVAVWGNLHGAVLVGVAVAVAYLILSRGRIRPQESVAVGLAVLVALWATPAGLRSHEYYIGVLTSEAAATGRGMWGMLRLTDTADLLVVIAGVVLVVAAVSRRLPLWEWTVVAGLMALALHAGRNGVWLLAFLVPRAALAIPRRQGDRHELLGSGRRRVATAVSLAIVAGSVWFISTGVAKQASVVAARGAEASEIAAITGPDRATLAPSPVAEWLAAHDVLLWASNPLDALPRERQRAYLDFLSQGASVATDLRPRAGAIVLPREPHERQLASYVLAGHTAHYDIYVSKAFS